MSPTPPLREVLGEHAARFVLIAAFPRLAARLRWPTRLGPRGVVLYIAMNTAIGFALRAWIVPYLKDKSVQVERAKIDLRGRLGREPTPDELVAYAKRQRAGEA